MAKEFDGRILWLLPKGANKARWPIRELPRNLESNRISYNKVSIVERLGLSLAITRQGVRLRRQLEVSGVQSQAEEQRQSGGEEIFTIPHPWRDWPLSACVLIAGRHFVSSQLKTRSI